tara:strand:- start:252 stop:392 length:141 start_codon:yes stop_codon:yes gene_type:complete
MKKATCVLIAVLATAAAAFAVDTPIVTNGTFQFSTTNSHRYYRFSF